MFIRICVIAFSVIGLFCQCSNPDTSEVSNDSCSNWTVSVMDAPLIISSFSKGGEEVVVIPSCWKEDNLIVYHNGELCTNWKSLGLKIEKSNVPSIIITTKYGSMDKVNSSLDKSISETGTLLAISKNGDISYNGELKKIHGRGNMSWKSPKKPYNIKLARRVSLFGLPDNKSFSLVSNGLEPSQMRNRIALPFAEVIDMPCAVKTENVSLWIDGKYMGLYLLTEKVSTKLFEAADSEAASVMLEIPQSGSSPKNVFNTEVFGKLSLKDPKKASSSVEKLINNKINRLETVLKSNREVSEIIDIQSIARYYLLQEIFANEDAFIGSFFIYTHNIYNDSMWVVAPLWDMDNSIKTRRTVPNALYLSKRGKLMSLLSGKTEFVNLVKEIYCEEVSPTIDSYINETLDSLWNEVKHDVYIDNLLWEKRVLPQEDFAEIKQFLNERKVFLDLVMHNNAEEFVKVIVNRNPPGTCFLTPELWVRRGDSVDISRFIVDTNKYRFLGCFDSKGNKCNESIQVYDNMTLNFKWESSDFIGRMRQRLDEYRIAFGEWRRNAFDRISPLKR